MSGPMALAAYRGFKTQTRRPVKFPRPGNWNGVYWSDDGDCDDTRPGWIFQNVSSSISEPDECFDSIRLDCPFGRVGDRIYVRETFSINRNVGPDEYARITYLADGAEHDTDGVRVCPTPNRVNSSPERQRWTPSIHMPKWAARTWGTITDVRVERLQSIQRNEADAIAEGATSREYESAYGTQTGWSMDWSAVGTLSKFAHASPVKGRDLAPLAVRDVALGSPWAAFGNYWEKCYSGDLSWDANPWVWVVAWEQDKI